MPSRKIKKTFNAGEISEQLSQRFDFDKTFSGCSILVNSIPQSFGCTTKRTGLVKVAKCLGMSHLIPFEFSVEDSLIVELSDYKIRFYNDGEIVLPTGTAMTSITLDGTNEVSIGKASHGLSTGNIVVFKNVTGKADEINNLEFVITKTDNDNFTLDNTDSSQYTSSGAVTGTYAKPYEVVSPYAVDDILGVQYVQSGDVMYLFHSDYAPRKLTRVSNTSWTLASVVFDKGPFLDQNTTSTTCTYTTSGSARSSGTYYFDTADTGTITFSSATLTGTSADVGTRWQMSHTRIDNKVSLTDTGTSDPVLIKGDFTVESSGYEDDEYTLLERSTDGGTTWQQERKFVAATAYTSTEKEDAVYYRITVSGTVSASLTAKQQINHGIVEITAASSTTSASCKVIEAVGGEADSGSATTATVNWAEGSWSEYRGYPSVAAFHAGRLWLGSTVYQPDVLYASAVGKYELFEAGLNADNSFKLSIRGDDVSSIQWAASLGQLAVGTGSKEYLISAANPDNAISPTDSKAAVQSGLGSESIAPVFLNNALFFIQRHGRKMRAMNYDDALQAYRSDDATLLANTIFDSLPIVMAKQTIPDSIIWIVREDGTLLSFTYEPSQNMNGWARHITGNMANRYLIEEAEPVDKFISVSVIRGNGEDEVWAVVKRNGSYYVEKMTSRYYSQNDEAIFLDSSIYSFSGYGAEDIILGSDTVRYGSGIYSSSRYGGTI
jgi:hypothetical protein